jgi:YbbR domain-containing protein
VSFLNSIFDFLRFNKKNWKAVVLCLFAATVFWFFNALNKNYSANINFPVSFDYDRENFVPVKSLPTTIRMNVSGLGWDLFRKSSGLKVPPLVIPLERPVEVRKIVGSTLPALFSTQLERLQINFVITDTVYIDIDEKIRKKFNLTVDSVWRYLHRDFGVINEITLVPDTVWIEGPRKIVNALPDVIGLSLLQNDIDRDFIGEIEIILPNDDVLKRNPPVVEVAFDVEKLMEINDRIQLKVINAPLHLRSAIDVREVNCTFRLPVSLVNTLSIDSLTAIVDLKMLTPGSHKIVPHVNGLPRNAHLIKVDTIRINF